MKKILFIFSMVLLMAACAQDEELENMVDTSSPYVITDDDPNDPVKHKVYELYQKFQVPVFFTDTIQQSLLKYDANGNPIYKYETLDMRWTFSGYQNDAAYEIEEYETEDEKLSALEFVEEYLNSISDRMRPFCIYPVKTFKNGKQTPKYMAGFRILLVPGTAEITDSLERKELCGELVRSMVLDKVKQNEKVVALFTNVSQKNKWYSKPWKGTTENPGLSCSYHYTATSWVLSPLGIWDDEEFYLESLPAVIEGYGNPGETYSLEYAYEIRRNITKDVGQYGFISGVSYSPAHRSPDTPEADLEAFVNTIMKIRDAGFRERYGECPLVMQKYGILYDFITTELGVEL